MVSLACALALLPPQQQTSFPIWETDKIPPTEYKQRREKLMAQMEPGSIAVFFTNPTRNRNNDVDFVYRGDSNFLYLTGFEEPDAALVLVPSGAIVNGKRVREVLFVNEADAMSITWLGYRMGSANVPKLLGIEAAMPNNKFEIAFASLAAGADNKKVSWSVAPDMAGRVSAMWESSKKWCADNQYTNGKSLRGALSVMRGVKSPAEIALIKKACEISARGHIEAMRSCEPGMREWEIGSLVKYMFGKEGCEYEGYPPICGSGPNSTILHYESNRALMNSGDVMCMDTAGEFHGYSADVTRSFPVNGRWTTEQKAVYNVVRRAQAAGIALCKPGVSTGTVGQACSDELANGLVELGIIKNASELGRYYMHGFGHGIGLDVHDPMPNTLEPGVCLTVEPGIYIKEGSPCDKKWWNIGIRIEDDILVTTGSPITMSEAAPRDPSLIEKLMAETGIGNIKFKN